MVRMKCLTTKQDFDAEEPEVIMLRNGRYAYRVKCPWEGKNGKQLYAFKFASTEAYKAYVAKAAPEKEGENAVEEPESPEVA